MKTMKTPHTHHSHHTSTNGPGKEVALRWLAQQLRWEHLLAELRDPTTATPEEEAAA
jgi:hypothetical protein